MNNFEKLNLMVSPIEDPSFKRPSLHGQPLAWSKRKNWCSWEEREDVYPGIQDWYVIPPSLATYNFCGLEVGYWVLDIDNHGGDRFNEAIAFLKSCNIPPSLTIRTPSGGLHIYYQAIKDDIPKALAKSDLPIEIKSSTGVVAPNGRDRVIIRDLPVAYYTVEEGSKLASLARLKPRIHRKPRKPINPDYPAPEPVALKEGGRHDFILKETKRLQDDGCPDETIRKWITATCELSPGTRKITKREIDDILDWEGSGFDDDMAQLLPKTPSISHVEAPQSCSAIEDDTDIVSKVSKALGGPCVPLTGITSVWAVAQFEDDGHKILQMVGDLSDQFSDDLPQREMDFISDIMTANSTEELKSIWKTGTTELQARYVVLKDTVKLGLSKLNR